MAQIEFVFFDLGNVICYFDHELAWQQMADVSGVDKEVVKKVILGSDLQIRYETGMITTEDFFDIYCAETGVSPNMSDLLNAANDIFWLNYRIMPVISQLKSVRFPIGILSNTSEAHWEFVCKKFPTIENYFDHRILSYEVHCMKPDRGIYEAAIAMAGVSPDKIFFVDDRPEHVKGAVACGIDAIVFENARDLSIALLQRGIQCDF